MSLSLLGIIIGFPSSLQYKSKCGLGPRIHLASEISFLPLEIVEIRYLGDPSGLPRRIEEVPQIYPLLDINGKATNCSLR